MILTKLTKRRVGYITISFVVVMGIIHAWLAANHHLLVAGICFSLGPGIAFYLGRLYQAAAVMAWFEADSLKAMRDISRGSDESIQQFCDEVARALEK